MTWVGVTFDSIRMIMSIEKSKVDETLLLCRDCLESTSISRAKLRSLLGKLNHVSKMSPPARRFSNRLLALLRSMKGKSVSTLSAGAKLDLLWFIDLLEIYNCTAVIRSFCIPQIEIEVDACLVGGGGILQNVGYFFYPFPKKLTKRNLHISALESFNLLVALRIFVDEIRGRTVRVFCDNASTVSALNSGKAKDMVMAYVLRQVWFLCADKDMQLLVSHKPGSELIIADLLSRS